MPLLLTVSVALAQRFAAEGGQPLYPPMSPPFHSVVEGSEARAVIVLPPAPTSAHKLAAGELQLYLQKMSQAEVPVVEVGAVPAGRFRLLLGREHRETQPDRLASLGDEGFLLKTGPDYLLFAGKTDLGTLWAVYAFLEKCLGVRWFMPGDLGEVVAKQTTVAVGQLDETDEPDFVFRSVGANDWSRRNRMNGRLFIEEKRVGFNMWGGYHTFGQLLHPEKYFDEHPDWFPEVRGKRQKCNPAWAPPQGYTDGNQICTTNAGAIAQVVENIRGLLAADPSIRVVSVGPNDGQGWCECADCKAQDEPDVGSDQRLSRRLLVFYNAVAREVRQTHPDVLIKGGAYNVYTKPPRDPALKAEDNLAVMICHSEDYCLNHSVFDPACKRNPAFRELLADWHRLVKHVYFYEYYWKCNWCELPWAIVHTIRRDLPEFKRLGIDGLYTQYSSRNTATMLLNHYVAAKLLWDADLDVDALLADFYWKFYGPAAEPMRQYHEGWETALRESGKCFPGNGVYAVGVYTSDLLDRSDRSVREALRLADNDTVRQRLHLHELSLDYTRRYLTFKELAVAAGGAEPAKVGEAAAAGNELVAYLRANRQRLTDVVDQEAELIQYYLGGEIERLMKQSDRKALAEFDALQEWVALPEDWRFRLDPDTRGERDGWAQPDFDDSKWRLLKPRRPWHCQGVKHEGTTWFRCTVEAPAKPADPVLLALAGLKGEAAVYLNGQLVLQAQGPGRTHRVDVTGQLKYGAPNHLALKVIDTQGICGLYGGVKLAIAGTEVWVPGAAFVRSWVPPEAQGNRPWITTGPAATLSASGLTGYDGAWVEYELFAPRAGRYFLWLRRAQYQEQEAVRVFADDGEVGAVRNTKTTKEGHTEFLRLSVPLDLTEGSHRLRLVAENVFGWVDPINWIYLTPDENADPEAAQTEHAAGSRPIRNGAGR
ncbi:MAG: hypothetical protein COZ57_34015 [Armatimonadetes bacterium CG_4_8_14_3_um_filter_66_20]|nr:DUF4838 domain-containing protein [Armatimonadota bacterium]PIX37503.1 MAG: hypothetical protein COZ57_34015 [Armatimonadetes bacterium CG_4_8_14_3_um_filter_66_20]